jgi:hypothetical protein
MKAGKLIKMLEGNEDREVFVPAKSYGAVQNLTEDMIYFGTDEDEKEVIEIMIW